MTIAFRASAARGRLFVLFVTLVISARAVQAVEAPAKIRVALWFDTEDYILPESDDAAKKIADWLTGEHIRATFKVVGEKARVLERRGRTDVIEALKRHEIGYHSNWHSVQPTPAVYLAPLGWAQGVMEFDRRERPGLDDVARIFGQTPSCYGQPGCSWGPQSYGALKNWGMEVYLDVGNQVGLDRKPHYYCGVLNLYQLAATTRCELGSEADLDAAQKRFFDIRESLRADGGFVSIFYHPCEFVETGFWDNANFRHGANPPRDKWKMPPLRDPEARRVAWETFTSYVRFIRRFADVEFVTASDAARLYRDRARGRAFTQAEIKAIAGAVSRDVTFQQHGDYALSAAEVLALLDKYVVLQTAGQQPQSVTLDAGPLGPANQPIPLGEPVTTDWSQFTRTAVDVEEYLRRHGEVPPAVWLGSIGVPPEAYLAALAQVARDLLDDKPAPPTVEVKPANLAVASYVADDGPELWGWPIFPENFRAPAMMELAKRQAWTLKPAILAPAKE